ncbi:hypothetical protein D4764_04G0000930 [Takifugu flavidus]|uniref:Reverse transcriptase domain-containing protein n=1 Tax=Takifugu flavidus TaxID=433684 RepID=A0A5C6N2J1_9TELE|nr:hypothetical protein D4764_04G0000930 [Takifugu flavidus]
MANNRCVAEQRAAALKRKLMKNKEFLEDYRRFMDTILEKGYAMEVPQDQLSRDDNRDVPLNGQLMQGPDLTNKLIGALMRFREEPIAMMADIESMFYQVRVPGTDADLLRFLWWPNEEEAVALVKSLRDLCAEGGFSLTKWVSNSRRVLSSIPAELRATELKDLDLAQDDLPTERALGVQWCFSMSRCVKPKNFGTTKVARLHHFSDASEVAYGTASYLVLENDKGRIHCSLAMGKSRVSPLKQITVPRLELTAAE